MHIYEFEEKFPSVKTHTLEDIAKKHGVDIKDLRKQLSKGTKIEKEHTTDASVAKEIALDHLAEYPDYYDRLEKIEETFNDSELRNFHRGDPTRPVSGRADPDLAEIKQIISDEDYDEMFRSYGPMFVSDHANKRYDRPIVLGILDYLKYGK